MQLLFRAGIKTARDAFERLRLVGLTVVFSNYTQKDSVKHDLCNLDFSVLVVSGLYSGLLFEL